MDLTFWQIGHNRSLQRYTSVVLKRRPFSSRGFVNTPFRKEEQPAVSSHTAIGWNFPSLFRWLRRYSPPAIRTPRRWKDKLALLFNISPTVIDDAFNLSQVSPVSETSESLMYRFSWIIAHPYFQVILNFAYFSSFSPFGLSLTCTLWCAVTCHVSSESTTPLEQLFQHTRKLPLRGWFVEWSTAS